MVNKVRNKVRNTVRSKVRNKGDSNALQGRWLLPVLLTVQFLVSLDVSVVNIALPDMGDDLGFAPGSLLWVVNAYALAFGGLLMLGGRLADLAGRRRTLIWGFVVFGVASLAGGLALTPGQLIAARAVQGAGAAALAPVALTLITVNYAAGPARSRALGLSGASRERSAARSGSWRADCSPTGWAGAP